MNLSYECLQPVYYGWSVYSQDADDSFAQGIHPLVKEITSEGNLVLQIEFKRYLIRFCNFPETLQNVKITSGKC